MMPAQLAILDVSGAVVGFALGSLAFVLAVLDDIDGPSRWDEADR